MPGSVSEVLWVAGGPLGASRVWGKMRGGARLEREARLSVGHGSGVNEGSANQIRVDEEMILLALDADEAARGGWVWYCGGRTSCGEADRSRFDLMRG